MKILIFGILVILLSLVMSVAEQSTVFSQSYITANASPVVNTTDAIDQDSNENYITGITLMRARSLVGGVLGLLSVVIGWRAIGQFKAGIRNKGRKGAIVALSTGAIGLVLSIIHLSITVGAIFGSGSGKAGAIFGLIFSLVGITLGYMTLRKSRASISERSS